MRVAQQVERRHVTVLKTLIDGCRCLCIYVRSLLHPTAFLHICSGLVLGMSRTAERSGMLRPEPGGWTRDIAGLSPSAPLPQAGPPSLRWGCPRSITSPSGGAAPPSISSPLPQVGPPPTYSTSLPQAELPLSPLTPFSLRRSLPPSLSPSVPPEPPQPLPPFPPAARA